MYAGKKAKSLHIRPLAIGMALCNADAASAALMSEIAFRANITKYQNEKNPVLVFSYEEWSDLTGMSISQLRKFFGRLKTYGLLTTYVRPHPHKNVLKALHIEIPLAVHDLYQCLSGGMYNYLEDSLKMEMFEQAIGLPSTIESNKKLKKNPMEAVSGQTNLSSVFSTIVTTGDIPILCGGDTHYKKDFKKKNDEKKELPLSVTTLVSTKKEESENIVNVLHKSIIEELNIPSGLQGVIHLPNLLIYLRIHYTQISERKVPWEADYVTAKGLAALWRALLIERYGDFIDTNLTGKEHGLLKAMLKYNGSSLTQLVIKTVVSDWDSVWEKCYWKGNLRPSVPDVLFTYTNFASVVNGMGLIKGEGAMKLNKLTQSKK